MVPNHAISNMNKGLAKIFLNFANPLYLFMVVGDGFEPSKAELTDLQSVPFDRSGTPPPGCANIMTSSWVKQASFPPVEFLVARADYHVHARHHNEREHRGEQEAVDDHNRHGRPPLGG